MTLFSIEQAVKEFSFLETLEETIRLTHPQVTHIEIDISDVGFEFDDDGEFKVYTGTSTFKNLWNEAGQPIPPEECAANAWQTLNKLLTYETKKNLKMLAPLPSDALRDVRRAAAGNPNTSLELLQTLATDNDEDVRRAVAGNPNTPLELLRVLVKDTDSSVRSEASTYLERRLMQPE